MLLNIVLPNNKQDKFVSCSLLIAVKLGYNISKKITLGSSGRVNPKVDLANNQ